MTRINRVREELERIERADPDGLLTPENVVQAAQDEAAFPAIHKELTWDDNEAGHQWRLAQARQLIGRVKIITKEESQERYVNVVIQSGTGKQRRGYVPLSAAVANADLYEQIIDDAMKAMRGYRNRLTAFAQARKAVGLIDATINELRSISTKDRCKSTIDTGEVGVRCQLKLGHIGKHRTEEHEWDDNDERIVERDK